MAVTADPVKRGKPGTHGARGEQQKRGERGKGGKRDERGPRHRKAPGDAPQGAGSDRIERAVREQQRVLAAATAMLDTARVEDVHHGRVAARRLRSLLRTFRPLFEPHGARRYRIDLRSYARTLAAVREADARRALLLSLLPEDPADIATDRNRLDALLTEQCNRARDSLRGRLHEEGWTTLCRELDRHEGSGSLFVVRDAGEGQVLDLAAETWRRARRFLDEAPRTATGLHDLRLALKHCRYALEPVVDEASQAAVPLMRTLRRAQDALGEHRDTLLAQHWVQLNRRALGRSLTMHLATALERHECSQRRAAVRRARKAFEAWKEWRDATRSLRKRRPQRASIAGPG